MALGKQAKVLNRAQTDAVWHTYRRHVIPPAIV